MPSESEEWTIGRLMECSTAYFSDLDVDAPRLAAELLLASALGCERIQLYTRFEAVPKPEQLSAFWEQVRQAAQQRPIAYLVGKKEFYSLEFEVTPAVLIPRPATEVLVEQAIRHCRSLEQERVDVLDLGTGSGCIGVTLCRHLEHARVIGSDISDAALQVARRNAERLDALERFRTVQADGFDLPAAAMPPAGFDVLVSNPPYVAIDDADALSATVREQEPHEALFAGHDGLDFYRLIADSAAGILKPSASIFVEIGYDQHDRVVEIMTAAGGHRHVESWRDFDSGHLRVIRFDRES